MHKYYSQELWVFTMFKENFTRLCTNRGEFPTQVCVKLGFSASTYTYWKEDSVPRKSTLVKIADYFGVTVESLLEDKEETPPDPWSQTDDEVRARFLKVFDETDEEGRQLLLQMLEAAQKAYNENKGKK